MDKPTNPPSVRRLMPVEEVAAICGNCSERHVYRMADAGQMPAPKRIGRLVRWDSLELDAWIADGCPKVRTFTGKTRGAK